MEKLKSLILQYARWKPLEEYVGRIEAYKAPDFGFCVENAKALIESISREICTAKEVELQPTSTVNGIIKQAFKALGYSNSQNNNKISNALATIAQCIGELRNEIGTTSHGKSMQELENSKLQIDEMTKDFLLGAIELVSCLLINLAEKEAIHTSSELLASYNDSDDFNQYWDDLYGEFVMGTYSFNASDILYTMDNEAYMTELKAYSEEIKEENNE